MSSQEAIQPCRHMRVLVNRYAEGSLSGFLLSYVKAHLKGCARCQRALKAILALRERLRNLGNPEPEATLGEDRWQKIHDRMDEP